jgi:hypothetical protein
LGTVAQLGDIRPTAFASLLPGGPQRTCYLHVLTEFEDLVIVDVIPQNLDLGAEPFLEVFDCVHIIYYSFVWCGFVQ